MGNPLQAVWERRYFLRAMVWRDLKSRYRRSVIGLGWCLLHPLAMALILTGVFHSVFKADIASFLPFLLVGLAFWNYLSTSVIQGCNCFSHAHPFLRQYPTPLALFPMRTALANSVHLLATLATAIVVTGLLVRPPSPIGFLSLVPAVGLTLALGWSLSGLVGMANVRVQDVEHMSQIGLQIGFYVTPVLYPSRILGDHPLAWVLAYNPLVSFLALFREPILNGHPASAADFFRAAFTAAVMVLLASAVLYRVRKTLIFYL